MPEEFILPSSVPTGKFNWIWTELVLVNVNQFTKNWNDQNNFVDQKNIFVHDQKKLFYQHFFVITNIFDHDVFDKKI